MRRSTTRFVRLYATLYFMINAFSTILVKGKVKYYYIVAWSIVDWELVHEPREAVDNLVTLFVLDVTESWNDI